MGSKPQLKYFCLETKNKNATRKKITWHVHVCMTNKISNCICIKNMTYPRDTCPNIIRMTDV